MCLITVESLFIISERIRYLSAFNSFHSPHKNRMPRSFSFDTPYKKATFVETVISTRCLGVFGVVAVGFFWVAGGSYGNETLVAAGPPGFILWGVIGAAFFFALPTSMICAEICTAYPENGGIIIPVREALGGTWVKIYGYILYFF